MLNTFKCQGCYCIVFELVRVVSTERSVSSRAFEIRAFGIRRVCSNQYSDRTIKEKLRRELFMDERAFWNRSPWIFLGDLLVLCIRLKACSRISKTQEKSILFTCGRLTERRGGRRQEQTYVRVLQFSIEKVYVE